MPLSLQSKILRFLEQGEVQRIGGNDNLKVDVRVVAATNADLHGLVKQHLFREDLYYRLAIFPSSYRLCASAWETSKSSPRRFWPGSVRVQP